MSADLQGLIDRIRKEGLEKAESEAGDILAEARRQAGEILRTAESEAEGLRERARKDAAAFEEQGRQTLEKTARDLILLVRQSVERSLNAVVHQKVAAALDPALLQTLITKVVTSYCEKGAKEDAVDLLISPDDQARVVDFFLASFRTAINAGLEIRADQGVVRGFKIAVEGENVRHDFTATAIAEAMATMVRPRLSAILRDAAKVPPVA
ncbi:MAG: hypothetical protein U1F77_13995 [Kiritimatiellia bacterium]